MPMLNLVAEDFGIGAFVSLRFIDLPLPRKTVTLAAFAANEMDTSRLPLKLFIAAESH